MAIHGLSIKLWSMMSRWRWAWNTMCQAHAWHVPLSPKSGMFYLLKQQNFLVDGALSGDALRISDQYLSVQRSEYAHSLGIFPQSVQRISSFFDD